MIVKKGHEQIQPSPATIAPVQNREERVTFSITTLLSENPGKLYLTAKSLGIGVASVFRHNLEMYKELLQEEDNNLTAKERRAVGDVSQVMSLSHLCRLEGMPDKIMICDHLVKADRPDLLNAVNGATLIRLLLMMDKARTLAAAPKMNGGEKPAP